MVRNRFENLSVLVAIKEYDFRGSNLLCLEDAELEKVPNIVLDGGAGSPYSTCDSFDCIDEACISMEED